MIATDVNRSGETRLMRKAYEQITYSEVRNKAFATIDPYVFLGSFASRSVGIRRAE